MAKIWIGTSGWTYSSWKGKFYPADLPPARYLEFYANHFGITEVNYSFYHLPKPSTYEKWANQAPKDFLLALKVSRFISHIKRLNDVTEAWRIFIENASFLGDHLGPLLVQLPASFQLDLDRLDKFLKMAYKSADNLKLVLEFRHPSWFVDEVYELLSAYGAAFCIADSSRYPRKDVVTAKFVYYRFHGPKELFSSGYSKAVLQSEATKMCKLLKKGLDVYAFFNNDAKGHAVKNAQTLIQLIAEKS